MKKAVIFDLDGTLTDTLTDLTNSVNYAMKCLKLNTYSTFEVKMMIGNGVSVLMKRAVKGNENLHQRALELQREYYSAHGLDNTKPFDGVSSMLSELRSRGFFIIVHTNKDENVATTICAKLLPDLIDCVCGTIDDSKVKPNVERLLQLLNREEITEAIYCGDSEVDIETAKNARIPCVSVTWGFRDREFLLAHGATMLANTPKDVERYVCAAVE